jgi:hypothetical protein
MRSTFLACQQLQLMLRRNRRLMIVTVLGKIAPPETVTIMVREIPAQR